METLLFQNYAVSWVLKPRCFHVFSASETKLAHKACTLRGCHTGHEPSKIFKIRQNKNRHITMTIDLCTHQREQITSHSPTSISKSWAPTYPKASNHVPNLPHDEQISAPSWPPPAPPPQRSVVIVVAVADVALVAAVVLLVFVVRHRHFLEASNSVRMRAVVTKTYSKTFCVSDFKSIYDVVSNPVGEQLGSTKFLRNWCFLGSNFLLNNFLTQV